MWFLIDRKSIGYSGILIIPALGKEYEKFMFIRLVNSISHKSISIAVMSALMIACASEQSVVSDQPIEPSFQERVTECSKIADRTERDHCLHGNQPVSVDDR